MATLVAGLGYVGAALAQRLLESGDDVVAIENYFSTPRECIAPLTDRYPLPIVEGSVVEEETWERAFGLRPIDTVFYLAAQASAHPAAAPLAYTQETNYRGPRLLLDACRRANVRCVVCASSTRLYRTPLPRTVTESSPVHATDLVHLSQLYGELLLAAYATEDRVKPQGVDPSMSRVAARLGIVYGVGPVMKDVPTFLAVPQRFCQQAAVGERLRVATGSHSVLPFVHVADAVEGLLRCRRLPPGVHIVNVAAEARSVADVAHVVRDAGRARGLPVEIDYSGPRRRYAERRITSRLAEFGFVAARKLEDSLGEVLDHYLGRISRLTSTEPGLSAGKAGD